MRNTTFHRLGVGLVISAALFTFTSAVEAGPPLVCHPFEIGDAKSLPWGNSQSWDSPKVGYEITKLAQDTIALLSPEVPVIVRMETLRRAVIYSEKDQRIAYELLSRLMARALEAGSSGKANALAWFDAGYLVETYKQAKWMYETQSSWLSKQNFIQGLNGYAWVVKALRLGGDTASMEFAAALMKEGAWPNEHFQRALAGATDGSLLARNLVAQFGDQGKSIAELRAKFEKGKK